MRPLSLMGSDYFLGVLILVALLAKTKSLSFVRSTYDGVGILLQAVNADRNSLYT